MTTDERFPHLHRWTRPDHFADFAGFDRSAYFTVPQSGQRRDSDTLTRSNFRSILHALGGESDTVRVIRDSHWAVDWVEAIYIHESDTRALHGADQIAADLESYPVVDEDDWGMLELDEASDYWARMSVSERLDWCRRYRVSIFAARRDEIPSDGTGELLSALAS